MFIVSFAKARIRSSQEILEEKGIPYIPIQWSLLQTQIHVLASASSFDFATNKKTTSLKLRQSKRILEHLIETGETEMENLEKIVPPRVRVFVNWRFLKLIVQKLFKLACKKIKT